MSEMNIEGMTISSSVVETIVSIAAKEVDGVASIGSYTTSGLRSMLPTKPSTSGIEVSEGEDDKLHIELHIEVYYGYILPELAAKLRQFIADAVKMQVGIDVGSIDIYVDGIQFKK